MNQDDVIDKLLADMQAAGVPEEKQQALISSVQKRLAEVAMSVMLERLSPDQVAVLSAAIDRGPEGAGAVVERLAAEVPGLDEAMEAALLAEYEAFGQLLSPAGK